MQLTNNSESYGWIAICLHWLTALGVLGMFGLGLYMVELTYYDAWYKGSLDLHKSAGITLFCVWIIRVIWRSVNIEPRSLGSNHLESMVGKWVHRLLYCLLLVLFISGYLISTADGRSIEVWGIFEVPSFIAAKQQEEWAGDVHEILAWLIIVCVSLHTMAAIKHHIKDKDNTLRRILRPLRQTTKK